MHRATIGCVIPASNRQDSIAHVIESVLAQTRVPDVIHVVVSGASDATVEIASQYAGRHELVTELGAQFTEVFVHDIAENPGRPVDALAYGHTLVEGYDYLLGVDVDTVAGTKAVEYLERTAVADSRIGGISAFSRIDDTAVAGSRSTSPKTVRRSPFAAFTLHKLIRRPHGDKV
jgi:biofilm PGA synthesis N-glycosyltransferase PgaC